MELVIIKEQRGAENKQKSLIEKIARIAILAVLLIHISPP